MTLKQEVVELLRKAPDPEEDVMTGGASEESIAAFSARNNIEVPAELKEWLLLCNGSFAARACLLGIRPDNPFLDIGSHYDLVPEWRMRGWIPVAHDGCGSHWVLDTSCRVGQTHPIYFLDPQDDLDVASFVVASGLWPFLRFLLKRAQLPRDKWGHYWPYNKEAILEEDPRLPEYRGDVPFPWQIMDSIA